MRAILDRFLDEPAFAAAVVVGLVTAGVAVTNVLVLGGSALLAVYAGLTSLSTSLAGGAVVRSSVVPEWRAKFREVQARHRGEKDARRRP